MQSELYDLAIEYTESAALQSRPDSSSPFTLWDQRGHFFQPWSQLDDDDALPRWCSNPHNVFAPKV
jgi:hypothetical protein